SHLLTAVDLTPPYYDVNGDGFISPLDVLVVINFLNLRHNGEGEGNLQNVLARSPSLSTSIITPNTLDRSVARTIDQLYADDGSLISLVSEPIESRRLRKILSRKGW
ncbi:MAG: dockerin type I domain-containing protein, partial [Pirellula sp.]